MTQLSEEHRESKERVGSPLPRALQQTSPIHLPETPPPKTKTKAEELEARFVCPEAFVARAQQDGIRCTKVSKRQVLREVEVQLVRLEEKHNRTGGGWALRYSHKGGKESRTLALNEAAILPGALLDPKSAKALVAAKMPVKQALSIVSAESGDKTSLCVHEAADFKSLVQFVCAQHLAGFGRST